MFAFLLILCLVSSAYSQERAARTLQDFNNPQITDVVRVKTAKVIWANYPLIRQDFDHLRNATNDEINRWLESKAVISRAQAQQILFNSSVEFEGFSGNAYRPENYNRAAIVEVEGGFLDIKGAGSPNPSTHWVDGDPRDGTYTLGAAIREENFASAVREIFLAERLSIENIPVEVVPNYAILDGGFDVIHRNQEGAEVGRSPWGMLYRRAHSRFKNPEAVLKENRGVYSLWDAAKSLAVEKVLRKYGITSEGRGRLGLEGGINIQGTRQNAILDFGNFVVLETFPLNPVYHFYGDTVLLDPQSLQFVQPHPLLRLPIEQWGRFSEVVDSQQDKPWVYAAETARYVSSMSRQGRREEAFRGYLNHRQNMLGPFSDRIHQNSFHRCSFL